MTAYAYYRLRDRLEAPPRRRFLPLRHASPALETGPCPRHPYQGASPHWRIIGNLVAVETLLELEPAMRPDLYNAVMRAVDAVRGWLAGTTSFASAHDACQRLHRWTREHGQTWHTRATVQTAAHLFAQTCRVRNFLARRYVVDRWWQRLRARIPYREAGGLVIDSVDLGDLLAVFQTGTQQQSTGAMSALVWSVGPMMAQQLVTRIRTGETVRQVIEFVVEQSGDEQAGDEPDAAERADDARPAEPEPANEPEPPANNTNLAYWPLYYCGYLRSSNRSMRMTGLRHLQRYQRNEAVGAAMIDTLQLVLPNPDPVVRRFATEAVAEVGRVNARMRARACEVLAKAMDREPDRRMRRIIEGELATLGYW